jgi:hypothetical protein
MSPSCGITVDGAFKTCPQCGGLMRTSGTIRAFGWVMLLCGLAAGLMFASMGWTFSGGGAFTGTRGEAGFFLGSFSYIILFCLLVSANALYMVVTGRTNRTLAKVTLLAVIILVVGMSVIHRFLR